MSKSPVADLGLWSCVWDVCVQLWSLHLHQLATLSSFSMCMSEKWSAQISIRSNWKWKFTNTPTNTHRGPNQSEHKEIIPQRQGWEQCDAAAWAVGFSSSSHTIICPLDVTSELCRPLFIYHHLLTHFFLSLSLSPLSAGVPPSSGFHRNLIVPLKWDHTTQSNSGTNIIITLSQPPTCRNICEGWERSEWWKGGKKVSECL